MSDRKRSAPRALESSDVRRFRGVIAAIVVASISTIAIVALAAGTPGSPGPVSAPHRALECSSCHAEGDASSACAGCHGARGSTRHSALFSSGALRCGQCHIGHAERGVTFSARAVTVTSAGHDVRASSSFRPTRELYVPLVPASACMECHGEAANDPIASCVSAGDAVCFDEHGPGREAAWEAARAVAAQSPPRAPSEHPWLWILGAALLGAIAFAIERRVRNKKPPKTRVALPVIADRVRLPRIDPNTCLGCYACVDACPYDVLAIEKFVAVVVKPKDCCGLTLCEQVCPNGSLAITDGEPIGDRPNVGETLESRDVPGLYLAGDLTGAPLIRSAIAQGALAVQAIAKSLPRRGKELDLIIVGAGPRASRPRSRRRSSACVTRRSSRAASPRASGAFRAVSSCSIKRSTHRSGVSGSSSVRRKSWSRSGRGSCARKSSRSARDTVSRRSSGATARSWCARASSRSAPSACSSRWAGAGRRASSSARSRRRR